jgi:hypothetical protein
MRKINLMKIKNYMVLITILFVYSSSFLFAETATPVESSYICSNFNISTTRVTDSNSDGIYDTYTVFWCDGRVFNYPILAVGDIRRWPPRGIPTREISYSNNETRSFVETYYGINSSPIICQFIKYEAENVVYYFDNFDDRSKMISDVKDNKTLNLTIDIQPNPISDIVNINLEVKTTAWLNITLYNEIGILLDEIDNVYRHPGTYSVTKNLSNLPNGIYFITTKLGIDEILTRKIIINK